MRLENKVDAIPGSGGGMGTAVARLFASEGASLLLVARREPPLQEIAALARSDGGQAVAPSGARTEDGAQPSAEPGEATVLAPMPGLVSRYSVEVGQHVEAGDTVVVLEAMKMENTVAAGRGGTVAEVRVSPGDSVGSGDVVAVIE